LKALSPSSLNTHFCLAFPPEYIETLCPTLKHAALFIRDYTPALHTKAYAIRRWRETVLKVRAFKANIASQCGLSPKEYITTSTGCLDAFGKKLVDEELRSMKENAIKDRQVYLDYMVRHTQLNKEFVQTFNDTILRAHNVQLTVTDLLEAEEEPLQTPAAIAAQLRHYPFASPCKIKLNEHCHHIRTVLDQIHNILTKARSISLFYVDY